MADDVPHALANGLAADETSLGIWRCAGRIHQAVEAENPYVCLLAARPA